MSFFCKISSGSLSPYLLWVSLSLSLLRLSFFHHFGSPSLSLLLLDHGEYKVQPWWQWALLGRNKWHPALQGGANKGTRKRTKHILLFSKLEVFCDELKNIIDAYLSILCHPQHQ